ncbi:MAG TPA: YHS domain-containing protein [Pirellulales bacterium]|jgi:YHS domain-containing protein|nr:YHS domain-containing protein [Pirellulales bacterium]
MKRLFGTTAWGAMLGVGLGCLLAFGADQPAATNAADKAALSVWNNLVGSWKGVGQLQRGSSKGSWSEAIACRWDFAKGHAALILDDPDGKYFSNVVLKPGKQAGEFLLTATLPDGKTTAAYSGARTADGKLVLANDQAAEGQPGRLTWQVVAGGDRLVVLAEKSLGNGRYSRLGEIGYTRAGSGFGKGGGGPECVVTGGQGTIAVEYKGQTYYVCCSGCKAAFNENPEQILAEYKARLAKGQK